MRPSACLEEWKKLSPLVHLIHRGIVKTSSVDSSSSPLAHSRIGYLFTCSDRGPTIPPLNHGRPLTPRTTSFAASPSGAHSCQERTRSRDETGTDHHYPLPPPRTSGGGLREAAIRGLFRTHSQTHSRSHSRTGSRSPSPSPILSALPLASPSAPTGSDEHKERKRRSRSSLNAFIGAVKERIKHDRHDRHDASHSTSSPRTTGRSRELSPANREG